MERTHIRVRPSTFEKLVKLLNLQTIKPSMTELIDYLVTKELEKKK